MKKLLVTALAVVLMSVGIVGTASAIEITSESYINNWLWQGRTVSWTMDMPDDFEMPYDKLTSAQLSIYSKYVNPTTNGIVVQVNEIVGYLSKDNSGLKDLEWKYLNNDPIDPDLNLSGLFDVASFITTPWNNGDALSVSLSLNPERYNEGPAQWYFVEKAVLDLEYENRTAPVPEPGTMVLLGLGMFGLAIYGKRRMNRID